MVVRAYDDRSAAALSGVAARSAVEERDVDRSGRVRACCRFHFSIRVRAADDLSCCRGVAACRAILRSSPTQVRERGAHAAVVVSACLGWCPQGLGGVRFAAPAPNCVEGGEHLSSPRRLDGVVGGARVRDRRLGQAGNFRVVPDLAG
jgi:hypothetical protein